MPRLVSVSEHEVERRPQSSEFARRCQVNLQRVSQQKAPINPLAEPRVRIMYCPVLFAHPGRPLGEDCGSLSPLLNADREVYVGPLVFTRTRGRASDRTPTD